MPALIIEAIGAIAEGIEAIGISGEAAATAATISIGTGLLAHEFMNEIQSLFFGQVLKMANINSQSKSKTYNDSGGAELEIVMDAIDAIITVAQVINVAQFVIDATQKMNAQSSANTQSFEAKEQDGITIETVPAYEHVPWVETYPAPSNTVPQIESFPAIPKEAPTTTVFPDTKPEIPSIETIPAETPKELGDNILWNSGNSGQIVWHTKKYIPNTGIWTPTGNKKSEWLNENNYRTKWRNPVKDQLRNKEGKSVSLDLLDENGNIIGRIDKNYRVDGKVVPEHAHLDSDTGNVHHWFND